MSAAAEAAQTATLRVNLQSIQLKRKDGTVEDDFKTWAHTSIVTSTGSFPKFWYHTDADANFSKTSVSIQCSLCYAAMWYMLHVHICR
jgi:hypothetical protein